MRFITQPLQNCIGPTIRISREILGLPYAGFFLLSFEKIFNDAKEAGYVEALTFL